MGCTRSINIRIQAVQTGKFLPGDRLSIPERDLAFRHLLSQLSLDADHRASLQARGLSDAAIAAGAFRTVAPHQLVEVSNKLPGSAGGRFAVSGRGILCPAFDRHGRIIGAQIRRDDSENGRYRWLKGDRSSHLQSGELPLTVATPAGEPLGIAILEGILKPAVAAARHGYACIGAAGGLFNSSPEQFRLNIDRLSQQLGTTLIHFPVDAGGRVNEQVYKRDCETIRRLRQWGYEVEVGDWGQWDNKSAPDFDEIITGATVNWRPAREYLPSPIRTLRDLLDKVTGAKPKSPPRGFAPAPVKREGAPAVAVQSYSQGDRLAVWQQSGQLTLDRSETGSGKSFDAGRIAGQAIYVTADPRNVTTDTLRDWTVLEGRHSGLRRDDRSRLRRVKAGESYEQRANCGRTGAIAALRAKGIDSADRADLVCRSCAHWEACKAGKVYGYLGQRRQALAADKIVSHPAALPDPAGYDYSQSVVIWDEAAQIFKRQQQTVASVSDIQATVAAIALRAPTEFAKLQPWLAALNQLATGQQPRFGYSHLALLDQLPPLPDDLDLVAIEQAIAPDLDAALNPYDGIDIEDMADLRQHADRAVRQSARQLMKTASDRETAQRVQEHVINQWLLEAIAVATGATVGYLSLNRGQLTISQRDDRLLKIARAAQQNIFLDATGQPEELAARLDVEVAAIDVVAAQPRPGASVRRVQVTDMGRLGMQRGNFQQQQAAAVLAELRQRHPDLVTVDCKKHARDGDLKWFVESRGVNDAEQASAIALVGTPCPNVEALRADFATTYGRVPGGDDDRAFSAYVDRRIAAEIEQGMGRLRANRRPGEDLVVYLLTDIELPFAVEQVAAGEMTPEAMTKRERFATAVRQAIATLTERGESISQAAVARLVSYSRQYVSRLWQWVQQTLIDPYKAKVAPPTGPPDEVAIAAAGVLVEVLAAAPDEIAAAAWEVFLEWLDPPQWRACLDLLPSHAQQSVLAELLATLAVQVVAG